jgi:hypothetical protein
MYGLFKFRIWINRDCEHWTEYFLFHSLEIRIFCLDYCRMNEISL